MANFIKSLTVMLLENGLLLPFDNAVKRFLSLLIGKINKLCIEKLCEVKALWPSHYEHSYKMYCFMHSTVVL